MEFEAPHDGIVQRPVKLEARCEAADPRWKQAASATPAHPWRRREARRLLGTASGISVKPEGFSAKPSGYG
jgi:hypothetical protein